MRKIYTGRVLLALLSLLVINNCGGPNTNGAPLTESTTLKVGKAFGYYGDCAQSCFSEYGNTVSLYHSAPWSNDWAAISYGLSLAQSAGKNVILSIPDGMAIANDCPTRVRSFFTFLSAKGVLKNVFAIYPQDEPNLNSRFSAEQIKAENSCIRSAASDYQELSGKPLYAIYTCSDPWFALEDFDIIACDDYEIGDLMISKYLPLLKKYGKPIFLIPGGACDWNYNPYAMVVAANSDEQIIGIHAFLWPDNTWAPGKCGIKNSIVSALYQRLLAKPKPGI